MSKKLVATFVAVLLTATPLAVLASASPASAQTYNVVTASVITTTDLNFNKPKDPTYPLSTKNKTTQKDSIHWIPTYPATTKNKTNQKDSINWINTENGFFTSKFNKTNYREIIYPDATVYRGFFKQNKRF